MTDATNLAQFSTLAAEPWEQLECAKQLIENLSQMHAKGLAHGRIRPGSILWDKTARKLSVSGWEDAHRGKLYDLVYHLRTKDRRRPTIGDLQTVDKGCVAIYILGIASRARAVTLAHQMDTFASHGEIATTYIWDALRDLERVHAKNIPNTKANKKLQDMAEVLICHPCYTSRNARSDLIDLAMASAVVVCSAAFVLWTSYWFE